MSERVQNKGCYPSPPRLAKGIRARTKLRTAVAHDHAGVDRAGRVYVLRKGSSCNVSRLAMRHGRSVITINSATGMVSVK